MIEIVEVGLYVLFEALSIIFCIHYLYGVRPKFDIMTIGYIVYEISLMEIIFVFCLDSKWSLMIYPGILIYCILKFGLNLKKIIINNILNIATIGILQATIILLFYVLFGVSRMDIIDNLVINLLMFLIIITVLKKIRLKKLSDIIQSNEKIVFISMIVVIMSTVLFLITYKQNKGFVALYYVVLIISIVLIVIAGIDIGKHKIKAREAEAELRLHKLYEASFRELIDDICARQHEFDNHISTIYSQHKIYKTYDELVKAQQKYCNEVVEENHLNKILSKGNPVIICFLYSKLSEMLRKGIIVNYKINIGDLECGVPVHKLVELLGNLMKNAIEAIQKRGEGKIYFMMLEEKGKVHIEVSNENEKIEKKQIKEFFKKGYSEKGMGRGYGLYNVGKICAEYGIGIIYGNEEKEGKNYLVFQMIIDKRLPH